MLGLLLLGVVDMPFLIGSFRLWLVWPWLTLTWLVWPWLASESLESDFSEPDSLKSDSDLDSGDKDLKDKAENEHPLADFEAFACQRPGVDFTAYRDMLDSLGSQEMDCLYD